MEFVGFYPAEYERGEDIILKHYSFLRFTCCFHSSYILTAICLVPQKCATFDWHFPWTTILHSSKKGADQRLRRSMTTESYLYTSMLEEAESFCRRDHKIPEENSVHVENGARWRASSAKQTSKAARDAVQHPQGRACIVNLPIAVCKRPLAWCNARGRRDRRVDIDSPACWNPYGESEASAARTVPSYQSIFVHTLQNAGKVVKYLNREGYSSGRYTHSCVAYFGRNSCP